MLKIRVHFENKKKRRKKNARYIYLVSREQILSKK